jgi:hypothetical protein
MAGIAHLTSAIAAHLREWQPSPPFVELAIFETSDPEQIAQKLDAFCEEVLGARVVRGLFYQSSIGSVTGVALSDARSVRQSPAILGDRCAFRSGERRILH